MTGLWIEDGGVGLRHDLPRPTPASDEDLVAVRLAGICGTDLQLLTGYADWCGIPGHEFVGRIVGGERDGERVVADINIGCGRCARCRAGARRHCETRRVIGIRGCPGAHASHLTVPTANLLRVPDDVSDDRAVFAEPLAAALRVTEQVEPRPGERWLIVGDGKLGQLVARVLAPTAVDVSVVGRHERKLALAQTAGARPVAADAASGPDYDVVVECSGSPSGLATALARVRPRGTIVLKSTYSGTVEVDASRAVVDEVRIVGSRCGSIDRALDLLSSPRLDLSGLVDARFALTDGEAAFTAAGATGALKVLITMPSS